MNASGIFPSDDWAIAQGETPDGPLLVRYRTGDPTPADRRNFDKLILVRWSFEAHDQSGFPSAEELGAMEEFENRALDVSDEERWWGSCVAVLTHNATREWRFYTPNVEAFQEKFSEALHGMGPYPLDLEVFDDPDWTALEELRESAR